MVGSSFTVRTHPQRIETFGFYPYSVSRSLIHSCRLSSTKPTHSSLLTDGSLLTSRTNQVTMRSMLRYLITRARSGASQLQVGHSRAGDVTEKNCSMWGLTTISWQHRSDLVRILIQVLH